MPRLYVTNDSYPELRGITARWSRTRTWWRAIRLAATRRHFWIFVAVQAAVLVGANALATIGLPTPASRAAVAVRVSIAVASLGVVSYLQVSWGGDMMRRHLRAVSDVARYACPSCGQSLFGHLDDAGDPATTVRCPECAAEVARDIFEPPYPIPRAFRAFPPWG